MVKIFISDALYEDRAVTTATKGNGALWGWKKLAALYEASFADFGFQIIPVQRPEIYHTKIAHKSLSVDSGDWHLAVRPMEHLRPFHHMLNAFVCNWPFSLISTSNNGKSPFYNQKRLLNVADVVLCCNSTTHHTLRQANITKSIVLPPIIPAPKDLSAIVPIVGRTRFLTVVEDNDLDIQLTSLIEGFGEAAQRNSLYLTICLQTDDDEGIPRLRELAMKRWPIASPPLTERISFIRMGHGSDVVPYQSADFFLCTHAAPGLFIPAVEAMLAGLPLVTTMTGGIADLLLSDIAIPIRTKEQVLIKESEPLSHQISLIANPATAEGVCSAVLNAAALDRPTRHRYSEAARLLANEKFGRAAFHSGLHAFNAFIPLNIF